MKSAESHYSTEHNVTFFSVNGTVQFIDHANANAVVDTGLSLSTTEVTTFSEYAGDIYLTNPTDGIRQIHMGRVNDAAATSGDADITVDQNLAGRLIAFGDTAGTLRIANTSPFTEAYTAVAATGVITLTNTLNATVPNDTIVYTVEDISSGRPKGQALTFWKERMIVWGVTDDQATYNATTVDKSSNVVYMSKFAIRESLENIISFDTSSTAEIIQIGKGGSVTNVISTRDYLYYFTESETYFSSVADVDLTSGATLPQLLSGLYGCKNYRTAADLGNGLVAFLTNNNRIIGIRISTETGAPVVFPDESFDVPLQNTLEMLNQDQANAKFFYSKLYRRLFCDLNVDSVRTVFVYDNTISKWTPPHTNKSFRSYFEMGGELYATALSDDTIYRLETTKDDDNQPIECVIASAKVQGESGRTTIHFKELDLSGGLSEGTSVSIELIVDDGSPLVKTISSSGVSFADRHPLGSVTFGSEIIGGSASSVTLGDWEKRYAIYPCYGSQFQFVCSCLGQGQAFAIDGYTLHGQPLSVPLLTLN